MTLSTDDSRPGSLPTSAYSWILNPFCELLFLARGDVVVNHLDGTEIRLRNLALAERIFLQELDQLSQHNPRLTADQWATCPSRSPDLQRLIKRLLDEGVVYQREQSNLNNSLSEPEFTRYKSFLAWLGHFSGEPFGFSAFAKLRSSSVTVIGAGGAGSIAAVMLAACGIGELRLIDGDVVELSNLVRQVFYTETDVLQRVPKVCALARHIRSLNSSTKTLELAHNLTTEQQICDAIAGSNMVLMTADQPRILINRLVNTACVRSKISLLYTFFGQVGPIYVPDTTACFACLESEWANEGGEIYTEIIDALQLKTHVEYPSMVGGPARVAEVLTNETLGYLTNIYSPRSATGIVYPDDPRRFKLVERNHRCEICASTRRP